MSQTETLMYKVVFLGNKGVGIHSLVSRLTGNAVVQRAKSIPGVRQEEYKKRSVVHNKKEIEFAFYETLGQEQFRGSLTSSYFRYATGIIYVYDETNAQSFHDLKNWVKESAKSDGAFPFLIGNKVDLIQGGAPKAVDDATVNKFASDLMTNAMHVSATTGFGCEEAFKFITEFLINNAKASVKANVEGMDGFGLDDDQPPQSKTKKSHCSV